MVTEIQTSELRKHLQQMVRAIDRSYATDVKYPSWYHFFLEKGEDFTPAPRPKGVRKGRNRQCYSNALHLVFRRPDLTYVEGIACSELGIPVDHAWAVTADGVVVDPTWAKPELASYLGIRIPYEIVAAWTCRNKVYGVLVNDWRNGSPILTTGNLEVPRD